MYTCAHSVIIGSCWLHVLLIWSFVFDRVCAAQNVVVSTGLGDVMGVQRANYVQFDGIPYTENAPVGQYRFAEPVVRSSVYSDSVYNATYYRPACIQPGDRTYQSEDCLYLNIQSPSIDVNGTVNGDLLPVMVWIHGGAFIQGQSHDFDGRPLLRQSNVVFVSINYRLGSLGFLALESIYNETGGKTTGGLNGIYDQIVALQWIQARIEDFGGDPQRVTIFGESAGAFSVCWLTIIPAAANLFDQAIMQSGHCMPPAKQAARDVAIASSTAYLAYFGLSDDLDVLRSVNSSFFRDWNYIATFCCMISVDGYLLQTSTQEMMLSNNFTLNANKVIIGSNSLDTLSLFPFALPPATDYEFEAFLKQYISDESYVDLLSNTYYPLSDFPAASYYGLTYTEQTMRWGVMNADVCYKCSGVYYLQQILSQANGDSFREDVYLYDLIGVAEPYYVPHGGDIPFLFWNSSRATFAAVGIVESQSLSDFMIDAWTNFGVYGVPNSSFNEEQWLPFGINQSAMIFGNDGTNTDDGYNVANFDSKGYRNGVCDFWINTIGYETVVSLCSAQYSVAPTVEPSAAPTQEPTASISPTDAPTPTNESTANAFSVKSVVVVCLILVSTAHWF